MFCSFSALVHITSKFQGSLLIFISLRVYCILLEPLNHLSSATITSACKNQFNIVFPIVSFSTSPILHRVVIKNLCFFFYRSAHHSFSPYNFSVGNIISFTFTLFNLPLALPLIQTSLQSLENITVARLPTGESSMINNRSSQLTHPSHAHFLLHCEEGLPSGIFLSGEKLTTFLDPASLTALFSVSFKSCFEISYKSSEKSFLITSLNIFDSSSSTVLPNVLVKFVVVVILILLLCSLFSPLLFSYASAFTQP